MKYDEKFKKGESIAIIQFQYDYTCNFRCQHCSISRFQVSKKDKAKDKRRFFTISDVKELSRQADEMGLAHIDITGGEPLVFPDLDDLIKAIDPQKFYIQSDTNGWLMNDKKAKHLKSIGLDKIQLSLDSLSANEHDEFRRAKGSHERALRAIDASLTAGLNIIIYTTVTHQRVRSEEFIQFLEFAKSKGVAVVAGYAKPVGEWEGNFDVLVNKDDMDYVRDLEKKYSLFTHLTPSYGLDIGCIAVKRMIAITKYGDVMPCPWMYFSIGNFFQEPLKDIIQRGLKIKYFRKRVDTCLASEDREFINKYVSKTYGKPLPVPYSEIFTSKDDFIDETQPCMKNKDESEDRSRESLLSWRR
jgi:MoaA/NifB/PqqE/SkfB family radical SAM enzyme